MSMHPRIQKAHDAHAESLSMNERIGVFITKHVGNMWCAYVFTGIGIGSLVGIVTNNTLLGLVFGAVSSYFIQLVLLPIIMVGQAAESKKNDQLIAEIFTDTEHILRILQGLPEPVRTIVSEEGGELIIPNFVKEQFDEGKVQSLADIT